MENLPTLATAPDLLSGQDSYKPGLHELGVLLHSAAYSGLQSPVNAVLQSIGGDALVKGTPHIDAPEPAKPWTLDWNLQQVGTGIGMLAPILASRKLVTALAPSATAELAANKGMAALTSQEASGLTRYELGVSVGTGLVYGGLLSPSDLQPGQSLAEARLKQSASSAITFGTLSLANLGLKNLGGSELLKDTNAGVLLRNNTVAMALSGVPAGIVSVDAQSVMNGKGLPSVAEHFNSNYAEAIYDFSVVGAGLGHLSRPTSSDSVQLKAGQERAATSALGDKSSLEMLAEMKARLADTGKINDFNLDQVKAPANISYQRDLHDLPQLKPNATATGVDGSAMSLAQFESHSLNTVATPVRVYEAEGMSSKVVIPEEYAAKLDRQAILQEQAKGTGSAAEKARIELAKPEIKELDGRMTVEDAFRHALMTPEPGKFNEIHLYPDSNPYDLWYKTQTGSSDFASAADTVFGNGQTTWYKQSLGPNLAVDTMHEWTHLFDENNPLAAKVILAANSIDNMQTRSYAQVPREQIAILLGEHALNPQGQAAAELMKAAPVTAKAIADGLHNLLSRIPEEERSPLHDQLMARAELMRNEAGPVARQYLVEKIQADPESAEGQRALQVLVLIGEPQDLQKLASVNSIDMSHEPLIDSVGAKIGQLPQLTKADLSFTFIASETMRQLDGKPLLDLNLEKTNVTNAAMSYLPRTLQFLTLADTRISDQALPFLQRLQMLQSLDVSGTSISESGLARLKAALPNTRIIHT